MCRAGPGRPDGRANRLTRKDLRHRRGGSDKMYFQPNINTTLALPACQKHSFALANLREPMRRCKRLFELCMGVCSTVQGKRRKKKRRSELKKKKKKRRLDLSWVGPASKILPTIKSSSLYSLCILTEGVSMGETQESRCN